MTRLSGSHQLIKRVAHTSTTTYLGMGLAFVSTPLLAVSIGADGRGVIAGALVLVQILIWAGFLGLPRSLAIEAQSNTISGFGVLVVSGLGIANAVLVWAVSPLLSNGDIRIEVGMRIAAFVLLLSGMAQLGTEIALIEGRLILWNIVRAAAMVLPPAGYIVAFGVGQLSLTVAFAITLGGQFLSALLGIGIALSSFKRFKRARVPWSFSLKYWTGSALDGVGGRIDVLLLTALTQASIIGMYSIAMSFAVASGALTQALSHSLFSRLVTADADTHRRVVMRGTLIGGAISIASGGLVILGVGLLSIPVLGEEFRSLPGVVAILVLMMALNDQWLLRTYADSANGQAGALASASLVALVALACVVTLLVLSESLGSETMAAAMVAFAAARLGVRAAIISVRHRNDKESDVPP